MSAMPSLKETILDAGRRHVAVGHFNISDSVALRAIFEAARELKLPVIIGTSEGEREFLGAHQAVALVRSLRKEYDYPIFINADHTHSVEKAKEAIDAGYDAVLFDGGKLTLEENIKQTKEVVKYARSKNKDILIEGELGYIGSSSQILKEIPKGAAIEEKDLTKPEEAARFVEETGIDFLAPAIGNYHGIVMGSPKSSLNMARVKTIKDSVKIPLVLHGGSGTPDGDFVKAIEAGVSIVHINTEIRIAWRKGVEAALKDNKEEVTPYKLMLPALAGIKEIVHARLKLFARI